MSSFTGFKMFAIYDEGEDLWLNAFMEGWTDELDGECLFPTYNMAFEFMKENTYEYERSVKVYKVEIPQKEQTYEYSPVELPCDVDED